MGDGLGLDAWWDEPRVESARIFHLHGLFIFQQAEAARNRAVRGTLLSDLYRDDQPDQEDIDKFEWQTILAYMGATDDEVKDVQKRMGRVWR
jgi:hypothetical protein